MEELTEDRKQALTEFAEKLQELGYEILIKPIIQIKKDQELDMKGAFEKSKRKYLLHADGEIEETTNIPQTPYVEGSFIHGNTFATYEAAEKRRNQDAIATELREITGDQSWIDWENPHQAKYSITEILYNRGPKGKCILNYSENHTAKPSCKGNVYFKTPEARQEAIDIVGEPRIIEAFK